MDNASNRHQHVAVIASLKDKLRRLGSRNDDAGRFARAQFRTWIKRAEERLAAFEKAEASYVKVYNELTAAESAFDQKRAELLAAVETELAPFAQRISEARARGIHPPPRLDPFPWTYTGSNTEELAHKARHDPSGHHGSTLGEFLAHHRELSAGSMALAILEEDRYTPERVTNPTYAEAVVQEAFEVRWTVWASANRDAIAAVTT